MSELVNRVSRILQRTMQQSHMENLTKGAQCEFALAKLVWPHRSGRAHSQTLELVCTRRQPEKVRFAAAASISTLQPTVVLRAGFKIKHFQPVGRLQQLPICVCRHSAVLDGQSCNSLFSRKASNTLRAAGKVTFNFQRAFNCIHSHSHDQLRFMCTMHMGYKAGGGTRKNWPYNQYGIIRYTYGGACGKEWRADMSCMWDSVVCGILAPNIQ